MAVDPEAGKIYWATNNNVGLNSTISFAKLNDSGGGGEVNTTGATTPNEVDSVALLKLPRASAKPKVSGGSKVGSTLSCSRGRWAHDLVGSFLYQRPVSISYGWSRNGKPITDATTRSITTSQAGAYACTVTATNQAGRTKKTSATRKVT